MSSFERVIVSWQNDFNATFTLHRKGNGTGTGNRTAATGDNEMGLVPLLVLVQCEQFCTVYPIGPGSGPVPSPGPVQCERTITVL